jgi:hypothetical protein
MTDWTAGYVADIGYTYGKQRDTHLFLVSPTTLPLSFAP